MKKFWLGVFGVLILVTAYFAANATSMEEGRSLGLDFGTAYKDSASSTITDQNKSNTPGYTTDNPEQTKYYDGEDMSGDASAKTSSSEEGQLMVNGLPNRPKVQISYSDDFLNSSQAIEGNPDQVVAMLTGTYGECKPITTTITERTVRSCDQYSQPDCVEGSKIVTVSGDETSFEYPVIKASIPYQGGSGCYQRHLYTKIEITDLSAVNSFYLSRIGWDDSVRLTINGTVVYANGSFSGYCERSTTFWDSPNLNLKPYLVQGTNTIDLLVGISGYGFVSGEYVIDYPINKVCPTVDNCVNIPAECQLQSSDCLTTAPDTNLCTYRQNLYSCETITTTATANVECGSNIYCTNNQCTKIEEDSNQDFATSIAYLSSINQAAKDNNGSADNLKIFSGAAQSCEKDNVSYNNCCKDSGWGQDYASAQCDADEISLMEKQSKKLCHYVGSYCSEEVPLLNKCLKTKKAYCCFNSKISRVIMEQGRAQLGTGWGAPESPNCEGFTPDEMSQLHFEQMDLSEIASDIAGSVTIPDKSYLEEKARQVMGSYGQTSN